MCIHPGWPMLRTWPHVEDSWRRILAGPGRNQFILTNEAVTIQGPIAVVTLDENLVDAGGTGTVAATNVYAHSGDRWLLVVAPRLARDERLNARPNGRCARRLPGRARHVGRLRWRR